jgi:hypothetical protein
VAGTPVYKRRTLPLQITNVYKSRWCKEDRTTPYKMDGFEEGLKRSEVNKGKTKAANRVEWRSVVGVVKVWNQAVSPI